MGSRPDHSKGGRAKSRPIPKRRARKPHKASTQVLALPIRDAIEAQRRRLFRASAVVDMCRLACSTKYAEGFNPDQCEEALSVAYDLIDGIASALEQFASSSGFEFGG